MIKLSILICTIPTRSYLFRELYDKLLKQSTEEVEILFELDNKVLSIGAKRQKLLERSIGKYVVFIDDDDSVPEYYIDEILKAIEFSPDCIGFKIDCDMQGQHKKAIASNKFDKWEEIDNVYQRTIYHKTPVKRSIAMTIGFPNLRFGEDHVYSKNLKSSGLLKQEIFIDKVMYHYKYRFEPSKTKYNLNR